MSAMSRSGASGPSARTGGAAGASTTTSHARGDRGRGEGGSGGRPRAPRTHVGTVDYTLAKRALLRNFKSGLLSKPEICDAHPELVRAGRYLGEEAPSRCPVCEDGDLRVLAYVFADSLRQNNGRAFRVDEALALARSLRTAACYVVEVCVDCSWNHLAEAFLMRSAV
jgi:hypothetical protein